MFLKEEKILKAHWPDLKNNKFDIILQTNSDCNFSCPYCFQNKALKNNKGFINFKNVNFLFKKINNHLNLENFYLKVTLLGGEISCREEFLPFLEFLNQFEYINEINIITNGSFDIEFLEKIKNTTKFILSLQLSYHKNKKFNIEHYIEFIKWLEINEIQTSLVFPIYTDFDAYKKDFYLLKLQTKKYVKIIPQNLFKKVYDQEIQDFINNIFLEYNYVFDLTYETSNLKKPISEFFLKNNAFKGYKCLALQNIIRYSYLDILNIPCVDKFFTIFEIDKFLKYLSREKYCTLDFCLCMTHETKEICGQR